ncbi:MAG: Abi family protein [Cardiobacteriaceae bacterium]|nr:Abi family protein [Cardiobacteriaceae bacterium]
MNKCKELVKFDKPAKNNEELIRLWQQRNLIIDDTNKADHYLSFIGYYRLSPYTIPFQEPTLNPQLTTHKFKTGTTFDNILELYTFDRELRLLVIDAIERIEVAIRSKICNEFCLETKNAFWYMESEYYNNSNFHQDFLKKIDQKVLQEKNSLKEEEKKIEKRKEISLEEKCNLQQKLRKENFLRHYITTYDEPALPPAWMMFEMLTFGELRYLYNQLKPNKLRKKIATDLGLQSKVLTSWLQTLNDVRNICAHHGRLWNRVLGHSLMLPKSDSISWLETPVELSNPDISYQKRIYPVLVALQSILYKISKGSGWAQKLQDLINKYPLVSKAHMGMPEKWDEDEFWHPAINRKNRILS